MQTNLVSAAAPATHIEIDPDYKRVLVTGVGGPSGKAAITALKERGFFILGVDMQPVESRADAFIQVPSAIDPTYYDVLYSLIGEYRIGWLFPTVADELAILARKAHELRRVGITVFLSPPAAVDICQDKWLTAQTLQAYGVAVPASALGSAESTLDNRLAYPLVSRPRVGRGGRGVVVHDGPGIAPAVEEPIWQEFMSGTEYDVLCIRDPQPPHDMVMCQILEKVKLKEGRVGNAVDVAPVDAPDVTALAETAARVLSLTGPLDMDIRRGSDGVPRLLEINARIGAQALKAPEMFDTLVKMLREGCRG